MCPEEIESYLKDKYYLNSLLIKKKRININNRRRWK